MKIFDVHISFLSQCFIQEKLIPNISLAAANSLFQSVSGIVSFFDAETDLLELQERLSSSPNIFFQVLPPSVV